MISRHNICRSPNGSGTVLLLLSFAISGCTGKEADTAEAPLNSAPVIDWTVPSDRLVAGDDLPLEVHVSDEDGVSVVALYHRQT